MEKESLLQSLREIEELYKDFSMSCKMTDIVKYYDELNDKYDFNMSQFLIVGMKTEINSNKTLLTNDGNSYSIEMSITYLFKVLGIDFEFLDFLYNDELSIADKSYNDEVSQFEHVYKGRREFNLNSYTTADILMSKIADSIEINKDITQLYNFIDNTCYPNMGGYAAVENAFLIGSLFFEKCNYTNSILYFEKMKEVKSISEITISEFYKKVALLFFNKGLNLETLMLLKYGLELNPKLSVKKMMKLIQ